MDNRNLRAGERRKLARNMEENVSARRIGVVGFCLLAHVLPVLVLLGIASYAYATVGHSSGGVVLAATPAIGMVGGGRDFLDVMEEAQTLGGERELGGRHRFIKNFDEKLDGFIRLIANAEGMAAHKRKYLLKEAETTSDFPVLFGTVLDRTLLAKYGVVESDWRNYIKVGRQNDFRAANILGVWGLESELAKVAERGEYKADTMSDGKVANNLYKYGRQFPISWETMINDDLGAFSDVAERLANAALVTEYLNATRLFAVAGGGGNTSLFGTGLAHPIDAGTVANKGTKAFDTDALGDTVTLMRQQKSKDGNPIPVTIFHLVVPPALEIAALKALSPGALIAAGTTKVVTTSENVVAKLPIKLHVNPYLPIVDTSANKDKTWYLFAENNGNVPAAQMNFLAGHEKPEVVQRASNKLSLGGGLQAATEGDFETDTMAWRVRHILGGTQVDPRFAYVQDGTA